MFNHYNSTIKIIYIPEVGFLLVVAKTYFSKGKLVSYTSHLPIIIYVICFEFI